MLSGNSALRKALIAYGLGAFTEFATWFAVILVAYREGGPVLAGVAVISMLLPAIVLIPFVAGIGDKMPRSRALALTHVVVAASSALAGVLLVIGASFWSVLVAAAVLTVAVGVVRPMHFAVLPLLARKPGEVVTANSISSSLDGATLFVGTFCAGLLTDYLGAWTVLVLCALLSVIAAMLTTSLRTPPTVPMASEDVPGRIWAALAGFSALRGNPGAVTLLLLIAAMSVIAGANDILTVTFNDQVLQLPESTAGLLAGAYGVGLAVGGATLTRLSRRPRLAPVVLAGALLMGLTQAAVSLLGELWPAVLMLMLVGVGVSMILVSARTLLQRTTDDAVLARVLGVQEGVYLVGLTVGGVLGPLLIGLVGPRLSFLPLGAFVALFGMLSYAAITAQDVQGLLRRAEVETLLAVPFLAALLPYEVERLAQRASWVEVPAGAAVISQGEPGDSYYVVDTGELSVEVDGVVRDHHMVVGDGFGEIALLHQRPRTATVQALEQSRLLRVSAEDFLGTVLPNEAGVRLARSIAESRRRSDAVSEGTAHGALEPERPEVSADDQAIGLTDDQIERAQLSRRRDPPLG